MKAWILSLFCLLSLSACSFLPRSQEPAAQTYRLAPVVTPAPTGWVARKVLYVPEIEVNPALDSERITLVKDGLQQDFIAHSRWPDKLSRYLHASLVESLSQSGQFQAVLTQFVGKNQPFKLLMRVAHFEVAYPSPAQMQPAAAVDVQCEVTLIRAADQQVIQQKQYHVRREHIPLSTSQAVNALNAAWGEIITQIATDIR